MRSARENRARPAGEMGVEVFDFQIRHAADVGGNAVDRTRIPA